MDLILDTHVLLWMLLADKRLGERQKQLLESPSNRIHVSAVSAFEIATKVRIGKLPEARGIARDFERICRDFDYLKLDVTEVHGLRGGQLDGRHRDPFDRLLAAQSIVEGMPLVTGDPGFKAFRVETVW
jgi:PIN domain nuclease of toxin-antitoxin system